MSDAVLKPRDLCEEAIAIKSSLENGFLSLGWLLQEIKTTEAWMGRCTSFREFVETDMGFSVDNADKLIAVAEYIGAGRHVAANAGYSKIYRAMRLYPNKSVDEVLQIAETSTARELEQDTRSKNSGEHTCEVGVETWGKCNKCNRFIRLT